MKHNKSLKKLKGDASVRIFFRNTKKKSSSIIVYANKDKRSNLLIYDSINKILLKIPHTAHFFMGILKIHNILLKNLTI